MQPRLLPEIADTTGFRCAGYVPMAGAALVKVRFRTIESYVMLTFPRNADTHTKCAAIQRLTPHCMLASCARCGGLGWHKLGQCL